MLYLLCDAGVGGFVLQWRIVLALCIFIAGLWRPVVAYTLFVAAVAYPLYLVSIYVMALSLAVLILAAPVIVRFLPQALWLLAAPLWAPLNLIPVVPLLAGLWWGEGGGAIVGGLAALWLKIGAVMTGAPAGLWHSDGWALSAPALSARFYAADSLQTLIQIVGPLGSDSLTLLFNVLQVLSWAGAGAVVGFLARNLHARKGKGWSAALSLGPGLALIWAGYVAVPTWLQIDGPRWREPLWLPAQVLLAGALAWGIDAWGRYLRQPVLGRLSAAWSAAARPGFGGMRGRKRSSPRRPQSSLPGGDVSASRTPKSQDDQDIIMLELD